MSARRSFLALVGGGLVSLLGAGGARVALPASNAPDAALLGVTDDAELFHLSRDCLEANRRFRDIVQQQEAVSRPMTAANAAEWDRLDDLACKWSGRVAAIEDEIVEFSARTAPGSRLKREVLALSLPLTRRPAGLEQAIELTLAQGMLQVAP